MKPFEYSFSALRGRQAGREYYVVMCPLKLIPRIFIFSEEGELPPELRAQRTLNKARIPDIANYIINNKDEYLFSSLTASVDADVFFEGFQVNGEVLDDIGILKIPMTARFLINDGQHRRAAIENALKECPDLSDETISVVLYVDIGLKHSQQMFADLNKHAVRPTRSLGILYDHRDSLSNLAKTLVDEVSVFKNLTELEKTSISNRSTKLFTLSGIYQGTQELLRKNAKCKKISSLEIKIAVEYWNSVGENMLDWKLAAEKGISTYELRRDYIHAHTLVMLAIGKLGASLLSEKNKDWKKELKKLQKIDWSRKNTSIWEGRATIGGKLSKSHLCVMLTTNYLKNIFEVPLSPEENREEKKYLLRSNNER